MTTEFVKGDLLNSDVQYICHQVNCQGKMNSGLAKRIREKWPGVYEYYMRTFCQMKKPEEMLGTCSAVRINDHQTVINMAAQLDYPRDGYDGKQYTDYKAFKTCLKLIDKHVPIEATIGFPWRIGCGSGGAEWSIILGMIESILGRTHDVKIYLKDK